MLRRRYRLFTICSIALVFVLYRFYQNSWAPSQHSASLFDPIQKPVNPPPPAQSAVPTEDDIRKDTEDIIITPPPADDPVPPPADPADEKPESVDIDTTHQLQPQEGTQSEEHEPENKPDEHHGATVPDKPVDQVKEPSQEGTFKEPTQDKTAKEGTSEEQKPPDDPPPQVPAVQWKDPPTPADHPDKPDLNVDGTVKHWKKPKENFPVPLESLIPLPIGTPPWIPKIQYDFESEDESEQIKSTRLQRLSRVKAELVRAWGAYRKFAWKHDELKPLSNGFQDPFCGWAATLVDSLDTLWIADMKEEFDEAVKAVTEIDFTFTNQNDIPVFETTIRYLGGLLSAYDLSGGSEGNHSILLAKATELAEILMGAFDTPNRMPILFYRWQPPYSSQPHRAGTVSIAELASLSMEFTHLAQLTGYAKYYDAVDRITDALVEMQKAGTDIPGLFPERIDASGCNGTAATIRESLSQEAQKQENGEFPVAEGFNPAKPEQFGSGAQSEQDRKAEEANEGRWDDKPQDAALQRRDEPAPPPVTDMASQEHSETNTPQEPPLAADGTTADWDCEPQGLVAGTHGWGAFHLGGSSDSVYEYFAKVILLNLYMVFRHKLILDSNIFSSMASNPNTASCMRMPSMLLTNGYYTDQ